MSVERLEAFAGSLLQHTGVSARVSKTVASVLVDSDLRGVTTHGVRLLELYLPALMTGVINPEAVPEVVREDGALALVDGGGGLGQSAGDYATRLAIQRARDHGVGLVGVRGSRHWGAAAYYADLPIDSDQIGIAISLGAGNSMAPPSGLVHLLGNNPIAIGVPAGSMPPPILDMALSCTSRAQVMDAARKHQPIPEGWALDEDGRPTCDAQEAARGFLLPIGGHKGYGLSLMLALLVGALTGASIGSQVAPIADFGADSGHLILTIDVARLRDVDGFKGAVDAFLREIVDSKRVEGAPPIRYPGLAGGQARQSRRQNGIPLEEGYHEALVRLSEQFAVPLMEAGQA